LALISEDRVNMVTLNRGRRRGCCRKCNAR